MSRQRRHEVAVVPGEEAAPEAVTAAIRVIDATGAPIDWVHPPVGKPALATHGEAFPAAAREALDAADATFFGATSGASLGAFVHLRFGQQAYANVRPVRFIEGARSALVDPSGIDFEIVRENLEGLYVGAEGEIETLAPLAHQLPTGGPVSDAGPGRYAISVVTEAATRRITRFACLRARARRQDGRPHRLTIAAKHNILWMSDGRFREVAEEEARSFAADVEVETLHIDDVAHRMVVDPRRFGVIVTLNLYGDILSDLGSGLIGGLGMAPSGCYGETHAYFEPIHGTAPDLEGQGRINPTGQLLSGEMMLRQLGCTAEADGLDLAIAEVYRHGLHLTIDQGGSASTEAFADAVIEQL